MAEQLLDGADVGARFEQVGGEAVAEGVAGDALGEALERGPIDLVVNAAAYTAVDQAESETEAAFAVNAAAPGLLARLCEKQKLPLIHFSTDYVFDGQKAGPYREEDAINP